MEKTVFHKIDKISYYLRGVLRWLVIGCAVALIVWISIDTFKGINFMVSDKYMTFQFWVCVVFLSEFFLEVYFARGHRWHYFFTHIYFLLLSIPYLTFIDYSNVHLSEQALFYIRFVPLARGALAMSIVAGYVSSKKVTSLFVSYTVILLSVIYFSSLVFLYCEKGVNPDVTDYKGALWWCFMEASTLGAPFYPVTVLGKILAVILSGTGIIMFPLFTVYITSLVMGRNKIKLQSQNDQPTQPSPPKPEV